MIVLPHVFFHLDCARHVWDLVHVFGAIEQDLIFVLDFFFFFVALEMNSIHVQRNSVRTIYSSQEKFFIFLLAKVYQ